MSLLDDFVITSEQSTNLKFWSVLENQLQKLSVCFNKSIKQTLLRLTVFIWHKRFKEGSEEVEDDPRRGRPSTRKNETTVELEKKVVRGDCWLPVRLISNKLGLNRNSIFGKLSQKIWEWAKFVQRWFHTCDHPQLPHFLL